MGSRGPVPKRSEDRRRRNAPERPVLRAVSGSVGFSPSSPSPDWEPVAVRFYQACLVSGQAQFYEPSDYELLWSLCDDLSEYKRSGARSAMKLQALLSGFSSLLVTEGDRRRLQVETSRDAAEVEESPGMGEVERWATKFSEMRSRTG